MKLAVLLLLATLAAAGFGVLLVLRLRYVITDRHLKVTLFGVSLRRIKLSDVECVSKRRSGLAEKWHNTLSPSHRVLVIRRRRGWFKDFVITPKNRYVFKTELDVAIGGLPQMRTTGEPKPGKASPLISSRH
jgi:uncharacterized protein (UPF0248 family)